MSSNKNFMVQVFDLVLNGLLSNKKKIFLFFIILLLFNSSGILAEESVLMYPSYSYWDESKDFIEFDLHIHVFKKKENSKLRRFFIHNIKKYSGIKNPDISGDLFKERMHWFLIDNSRLKYLKAKIRDKEFKLNRTRSNGHSHTLIQIPRSWISPEELENGFLKVEINHPKFSEGKVYLIQKNSICLISDLDDTIKFSDVRNKKQLMKNSFFLPFQKINGMEIFYQSLEKESVRFFYVSASPWQMYTVLSNYFKSETFPEGVYLMKNFRFKDRDFFNIFSSPDKYKFRTIEKIFKSLPDNKFILVGDNGEKDPEAYADLAKKYPNQVHKILIRKAYPDDPANRLDEVFSELPESIHQVFSEPSEIRIR